MEQEIIKIAYEITEKISSIFMVRDDVKAMYQEFFKNPELCCEELEEMLLAGIWNGYNVTEDKEQYYEKICQVKNDADNLSIKGLLE